MNFRIFTIACALLVGISWIGGEASSFMKRKDKTTVFEVPTSGKIIDVKYHPEFDEWWVHCREGDNIVVYTYDQRNQAWGKVLFTAKKPDERGTRTDRPDKMKLPGDAETVQPKEEVKPEPPPKPEPRKEPDKDQKKPDRKWWDPLNILHGIPKSKPETGKY
ncbi:MAG TPA: hypothetical protein VK463_07290 [Desulfomonilaceae bacterium]|nr:hypothetical protein [Desulfomonilaceae bacterium]